MLTNEQRTVRLSAVADFNGLITFVSSMKYVSSNGGNFRKILCDFLLNKKRCLEFFKTLNDFNQRKCHMDATSLSV
jgi:hypothetical protein